MKSKHIITILIVLAAIAVSVFVWVSFRGQNIDQTTSQNSNPESAASKKLPADEEVTLLQKITPGLYAAVTSPGPTAENELGNTYARANIWLVPTDSRPAISVTRDVFQAQFLGRAEMQIDPATTDMLDVGIHVAGDGPFSWEEIAHDYIDINSGFVAAATSWVDNFSPVWSFTRMNEKYSVSLTAKMNCDVPVADGVGEVFDEATGIKVGQSVIAFRKPIRISCPIFAEGSAVSTLPGLGAPFFHDGHFLSFKLPSGQLATVELGEVKVTSPDIEGQPRVFPDK